MYVPGQIEMEDTRNAENEQIGDQDEQEDNERRNSDGVEEDIREVRPGQTKT